MNIAQPKWKEPEYTAGEINRAGELVRNDSIFEYDRNNALTIVDNWRAAHAYPLHVFYMNLRRKSQQNSNIIVAERLKRLDSIVDKLRREKNMLLYRMQDLGGCRVVLPTLNEVYDFSNSLKNSDILHELKREYDYICGPNGPKKSGYRSLHLVYRYHSDSSSKEIFNRYQMLVELQFRTHLQHIWATAVETIGLFKNQKIKAGQGDDAIRRFFVIVSSLFAIRENCPVVPGTLNDVKELISEIEQLNDQHYILDMLRTIRAVIDHEGKNTDKRGYYILQLNYVEHTLKKWFFRPSELETASMLYDYLEQTNGNSPLDTVLVRASSFQTVKNAYPNYFLDIGEFVDLIESYLR